MSKLYNEKYSEKYIIFKRKYILKYLKFKKIIEVLNTSNLNFFELTLTVAPDCQEAVELMGKLGDCQLQGMLGDCQLQEGCLGSQWDELDFEKVLVSQSHQIHCTKNEKMITLHDKSKSS